MTAIDVDQRPHKVRQPGVGNRGLGRTKGSKNKTTALLKDAILMAAELAGNRLPGKGHGLVKYLTAQALENPGPFMTILGKVMPMQLVGEDGGPVSFLVTNVYEDDAPQIEGSAVRLNADGSPNP